MLSPNTLAGFFIENRYSLQRFLGNGAFGFVFSANEIVLGETIGEVAVKLIRPQNDAHRLGVLHEIRSLAALSHPNLLAYRSAGECVLPSGETVIFLATELAHQTLENFLEKNRPTYAQIQKAAHDIASALVYLEEKNVVHRDLKPANVLRVGNSWKLADFGLARATHNLHQTAAAGTLVYMSPEAIDGEVSSCGDMWAFGVMLQECLTGRFPYPPDSTIAFIRSVATREPYLAPGLPQPFDQIVRSCIVKNPQARWTAKRVLECLNSHMRSPATHLPVTPVPASPAPQTSLQTAALPRQPHEPVIDAGGGGSHCTLTEALQSSPEATRFWLRPGIYCESLLLDKSIEIIGEGGREQIVLECGVGNCIKVTEGTPTIRGITIMGTALSLGKKYHTVSITQGSLSLEDCIVTSDSLACVAVQGLQASTHIKGCLIVKGNSDGVLFSGGASGTLENCEISQHGRHAVHIKGTANPTGKISKVHHCALLKNGGSGILAVEGGRGEVEHCEIQENRKSGVQVCAGSELHLRSCVVTGNKQQAISIERGAKGVVENCDLRNNAFGSWNLASSSEVLRRNNKEN